MAEINMPDGEIKFPCHSTYIIIIIIITIIRYGCLLSQAFSSWYFSWTNGDPHRSGFKLHTVVLSVLCVMLLLLLLLLLLLKILAYTFGLEISNRNFLDFRVFTFDFKCWNWPSTWCASAANAIDSDIVQPWLIGVGSIWYFYCIIQKFSKPLTL